MAQVFTDAQIQEILSLMKQHFSVQQYIGARYVPIFGRKDETSIVWDNSAPYEPLTIVLYQGNSYTSRQYVPTGVDINNNEFWAETGNYNAQIELYRQEVLGFNDELYKRCVVFETVSDMKYGENLASGNICHTNGFYTSNDGGGAWYEITNALPEGVSEANEMDIISCGNLFAILITDKPVNALQLGIKNDGTEDISEIFNEATKKYSIYFPIGDYLVSNTLIPVNDVYGASFKKLDWTDNYDGKASVFVSALSSGVIFDVHSENQTIDKIVIVCNGNETGVNVNGANRYYELSNIAIINLGGIGVEINPSVSQSRVCYMDNISIVGNNLYAENTGIILQEYAIDCRLSNIEIMRVQHGLVTHGITYVSNAHIWCGNYQRNGLPSADWMRNTVCILVRGGRFVGTNIYTDTAWRHITALDGTSVSISNLMAFDDKSLTWPSGAYIINGDFNATYSIIGGYVFYDGLLVGYTERWKPAAITFKDVVVNTTVNYRNVFNMPKLVDSNVIVIPANSLDYYCVAVIKELLSDITILSFNVFEQAFKVKIKNVNDAITAEVTEGEIPPNSHLGFTYDSNTQLLRIYANRTTAQNLINPYTVEVIENGYAIPIDKNMLSYATAENIFDVKTSQPSGYTLIS